MPVIGSGAAAAAGQGLASAVMPLALPPLPSAAKISIGFHSTVGESRSPFTGTRQVFQWPGEWLTAKVELPPMKADLARAWCAWLALLRGKAGTFLLGDTSQPIPRGVASGSPKVLAWDSSLQALGLQNLGSSPITNYLRSGDWLQLGGSGSKPVRLYMNILDITSTASGNTYNSPIFPRLREIPAVGDPVTLINPVGTFALASNDQSFSVDDAMVYGIAFDAYEAI